MSGTPCVEASSSRENCWIPDRGGRLQLTANQAQEGIPQPAGDKLGRVGSQKCTEFLFIDK